jgi:hypothetical protein
VGQSDAKAYPESVRIQSRHHGKQARPRQAQADGGAAAAQPAPGAAVEETPVEDETPGEATATAVDHHISEALKHEGDLLTEAGDAADTDALYATAAKVCSFSIPPHNHGLSQGAG